MAETMVTRRKSWKLLIGKSKMSFVLGTYARPNSTTPNLQSQWDRCDKMVLASIMHVIVKKIADSIMFFCQFS